MSENWKIQVSPKLPDGTLINIRAESADELTSLLTYAGQNAQLIADTVGLLVASRNATPVTQPQAQPAPAPQNNGFGGPQQGAPVLQFPQQGQPQAAPAQPGVQTCLHGAYIWKDFVSKAGNQVKGYFCPATFRTDCKPDFRK